VSSRYLGFGYIVYQICGAVFGALIAMGFTNYGGELVSNVDVAQSVSAEFIGSFLFTFIYLSQHDRRTKVSEDVMVFSLVVASTYITAIYLAGSTLLGYSPLNPAIAIGIYFS
jgi:glycerol uptake facilitator-like aquaporin